MYDSGDHTVEEIAATFHVSRPTMYRQLTSLQEGRDCVLVVYRSSRRTKTDASNRRLGETGQSEKIQKDTGDPRPHVRGKLREYLVL